MLNSNFSQKPFLLEQLICLKLGMYLFVLLTWGCTIHSPLTRSNLCACLNQWVANRGQTGCSSFTYAFFFYGQKIMEMSSYFMPLKVPSFFCHLWKMQCVMIVSKNLVNYLQSWEWKNCGVYYLLHYLEWRLQSWSQPAMVPPLLSPLWKI